MDVGVWVAALGAGVSVAAAVVGWRQANAATAQAAAAQDALAEARKQTGLAEAAAQDAARQSEAATRSATAAEEANTLARSHVTLVPDRVQGDVYQLRNTGNLDATGVWLRRRRADTEEWRSEPITIHAQGGESPTFDAKRIHWPLTVIIDQTPGTITLECPPKPPSTLQGR